MIKCLLFVLIICMNACTNTAGVAPARLATGKQLAFERNKGNCLACHVIGDGESPGNIGPPLTALPSKFKDKQKLRRQIFDASVFNPETSMPPFGKNNILTTEEIDAVVDYLWTLP